VILTDLRKRDLDGQSLYREIAERWPEHAAVVFITGDTLAPPAQPPPLEWLDRAAVLIPPPRRHCRSAIGVLAPTVLPGAKRDSGS
jgi:hypothetical protein